jgi:hypothetical protein
MNGKRIGLCAAAVALPLSVLAPVTADASKATSTSAVVSDSTTAAAKVRKPYASPYDWTYYYDEEYFQVRVKYRCSTKGKHWKWGKLLAWVDQKSTDAYYTSDVYRKARCDGKTHYKWLYVWNEGDDRIEEGDIRVWGKVVDPQKKRNQRYKTYDLVY